MISLLLPMSDGALILSSDLNSRRFEIISIYLTIISKPVFHPVHNHKNINKTVLKIKSSLFVFEI